MTRLGQHFLVREDIAERILAAAAIRPGERVLEIGPGEGVLTRRLVAAGATLTTIELDRTLARHVERTVPGIAVLHGDAARIEWPPFDALVANLPFQISSPVLFRLFDAPGWSRAVLMVQKEFADRLTAAPDTPEYGRLTVKRALRADAERIVRVPRGAFRPPPEVDAAVVRLTPLPRPLVARDPELLDALVDFVFTQRRKQLGTSLRSFARGRGLDGATVAGALEALGHAKARPGELTPGAFVELADALTVPSRGTPAPGHHTKG